MSKAVTAALAEIGKAFDEDAEKPPTQAVMIVIGEALSFLERIALALEEANKRPTITAMGEGSVVGELAHFEPVVAPEQVERALKALELIAAKVT